jgi:hypothetical protein
MANSERNSLDRGLELALAYLNHSRTSSQAGDEDRFDLETAIAAVEQVRDLMTALGEGSRELKVTHFQLLSRPPWLPGR